MSIQEPLGNNYRANNIMRGIRNSVNLLGISKKSTVEDEMDNDDEEANGAMDMDDLDVDAMEAINPSSTNKAKGKSKGSSKVSGFNLNEHDLWKQKRFLTTSEVRTYCCCY